MVFIKWVRLMGILCIKKTYFDVHRTNEKTVDRGEPNLVYSLNVMIRAHDRVSLI